MVQWRFRWVLAASLLVAATPALGQQPSPVPGGQGWTAPDAPQAPPTATAAPSAAPSPNSTYSPPASTAPPNRPAAAPPGASYYPPPSATYYPPPSATYYPPPSATYYPPPSASYYPPQTSPHAPPSGGCAPNVPKTCTCPNGTVGSSVCDASGANFYFCSCSGLGMPVPRDWGAPPGRRTIGPPKGLGTTIAGSILMGLSVSCLILAIPALADKDGHDAGVGAAIAGGILAFFGLPILYIGVSSLSKGTRRASETPLIGLTPRGPAFLF